VVGLEATARTDSNYNTMTQRAKSPRKRVTHIPLVFPGFRREPRFHLFESFLQKGIVDKRITESPLKVIQSRKDSRDIFPICFRVDRFIAQMRQTFRSTVRDQFLNRRLHKGTDTKRSVEHGTVEESESPSLGADNRAVSSSTGLRYVRLRRVSRWTNLTWTVRHTCKGIVRERVIPEHIKCALHAVWIRTHNQRIAQSG
jgi:hypothetical protein